MCGAYIRLLIFIAARPTMERGWLHEIFGNLYLNIQFDTITPCNRFFRFGKFDST